MIMNLNVIAQDITEREGLKKNISIAQVKEVLKILFTQYELEEVVKMWIKYNR